MENPLDVIDRTVSSYTGGIHTDQYYAQIYANEANGVATETLVIDTKTDAQGSQKQGGSVAPNSGQNTSESPVDVFLRTSAPASGNAPTQTSKLVPTQNSPQYTQTVGAAHKPIDVTPVTAFSFVLNAAFSFAVVMSVIGLMFVVYVMMRTRQLHHHEHHVKELGGHTEEKDADVVVEETIAHTADDVEAQVVQQVDSALLPPPQYIEEAVAIAPIPKTSLVDGAKMEIFVARLAAVRRDAASDDEDAWYTALMEVNVLLEDLFEALGFVGSDVKEMLASEQGVRLATHDVALEAEAEFQRLISGEKPLTHDAITTVVNLYAKVCKELGVVIA
jgi:hypothetical protein